MESPIKKMFKVGKVSVGLVGLDMALKKVADRPELDIATLVEQVYEEITARNYIPAIAADVFQVNDLDEIGRYGVMQTPALVINGRVKCAGRLPTRAQVEGWFRANLS
jgi:hypothetical protein